ncbi:unnamed protein product [Caenorhabditis sp. 36 PRJEB53466]|nr:unnamed protein product [Caenorhabditis sp. 36 PRJEB53466]
MVRLAKEKFSSETQIVREGASELRKHPNSLINYNENCVAPGTFVITFLLKLAMAVRVIVEKCPKPDEDMLVDLQYLISHPIVHFTKPNVAAAQNFEYPLDCYTTEKWFIFVETRKKLAIQLLGKCVRSLDVISLKEIFRYFVNVSTDPMNAFMPFEHGVLITGHVFHKVALHLSDEFLIDLFQSCKRQARRVSARCEVAIGVWQVIYHRLPQTKSPEEHDSFCRHSLFWDEGNSQSQVALSLGCSFEEFFLIFFFADHESLFNDRNGFNNKQRIAALDLVQTLNFKKSHGFFGAPSFLDGFNDIVETVFKTDCPELVNAMANFLEKLAAHSSQHPEKTWRLRKMLREIAISTARVNDTKGKLGLFWGIALRLNIASGYEYLIPEDFDHSELLETAHNSVGLRWATKFPELLSDYFQLRHPGQPDYSLLNYGTSGADSSVVIGRNMGVQQTASLFKFHNLFRTWERTMGEEVNITQWTWDTVQDLYLLIACRYQAINANRFDSTIALRDNVFHLSFGIYSLRHIISSLGYSNIALMRYESYSCKFIHRHPFLEFSFKGGGQIFSYIKLVVGQFKKTGDQTIIKYLEGLVEMLVQSIEYDMPSEDYTEDFKVCQIGLFYFCPRLAIKFTVALCRMRLGVHGYSYKTVEQVRKSQVDWEETRRLVTREQIQTFVSSEEVDLETLLYSHEIDCQDLMVPGLVKAAVKDWHLESSPEMRNYMVCKERYEETGVVFD